MHELGLTMEIVAIACERARESQASQVKRVVLEIGKLSCVLPDAIQFCFELCTQDTLAEGAELEIREIPGRARCRVCGQEILLDQPFGYCSCGQSDLEWLAGEELTIKELEIV